VKLARGCLLGLLLVAPASSLAQGSLPPCIQVEGVARWGADAYNHVVRVTNGCDRPARCQVATDVSPAPQAIEVAPGRTVELITFRGAPGSGFTPRVTCEITR